MQLFFTFAGPGRWNNYQARAWSNVRWPLAGRNEEQHFFKNLNRFQDDLAVSDDSDDEDKGQGHQTKQEPPDEDDPMAFWDEFQWENVDILKKCKLLVDTNICVTRIVKISVAVVNSKITNYFPLACMSVIGVPTNIEMVEIVSELSQKLRHGDSLCNSTHVYPCQGQEA